MTFTEHHLSSFFNDPVIIARAFQYFEEGRVLSLAATRSRLEGRIRGSEGKLYHASVKLFDGELWGGCSCPYPRFCKHLGALLLAAFHSEEIPYGWKRSLMELEAVWMPEVAFKEMWPRANGAPPTATLDERRMPPVFGRRDLSGERRTSRSWLNLDGDSRGFKTRLLEEGEEPVPGSRVLHLMVVSEPDYPTALGRWLYVTPLVRYIRRDGSAGAFSPWRPRNECVARARSETELLPQLSGREGRRLPLSRILPQRVLGGASPPLWVMRPSGTSPDGEGPGELEFYRISRLELSFFPVFYTGDRVLFEPCLAVETDGGARYPLNGKLQEGLRRWLEGGHRRFLVERRMELLREALGRRGAQVPAEEHYWVSVEEGMALLIDRDRGIVFWSCQLTLRRVLREFDPEIERELSYSDILSLREQLDQTDRGGLIELLLPPTEAEIVELAVQLVVEIEEGTVAIRSDVPSREVEEVPGDQSFLLEFYDNDKADLERQRLAGVCAGLLAPLNPIPCGDAALLCEGSVAEIVELIAEPMVEAGVRIEVAGRPARTGELSFAFRVTSSGEDWFSIGLTTKTEEETVRTSPDGSFAYASDGSIIIVRNREELARLKKRLHISAEGTVRLREGEFLRLAELDGLIQEEAEESTRGASRMVELMRRARERRDAWLRLAEGRHELDRAEPPGFGTTLRPYQRYGLGWLLAVTEEGFGALLADEMGLGKTVQALALLQANVTGRLSSKVGGSTPISLVVAPPATIENWRHEVCSFAPALSPLVYHGADRAQLLRNLRSGAASETFSGAPLLITSYQTLLKDGEALAEVEWEHVIFDEVQQIKNAKTKSHRAARKLRAKRVLALSGTPVENSSLELYAVMDLLNPGILGTRASFLNRFGSPIEREGDEVARRRLRELLTPLILRRRKSDVAKELPSRDEIPLYVSLPPFQRRVYEKIRREYSERIRIALSESDPYKRLLLILEGLTRLRQAALDPRLLPAQLRGKWSGESGQPGEPGKLAALTHLVPRITKEGHRVLIFSQFVSLLTILRDWAKGLGYEYCYLDGSMTPARRKKEITRFQESGGPPLFFISLRAGGVGINLTAAEYVILIDPWWNPAVEDQAIDRSHRIGQTRPVTAYRLIASDTVEERIAALQARKRRLVSDILPDDSAMISSLSSEEILELFSP
ncbi:MAG: SNF2-related protein [Spirochaetaceae bacterium]